MYMILAEKNIFLGGVSKPKVAKIGPEQGFPSGIKNQKMEWFSFLHEVTAT